MNTRAIPLEGNLLINRLVTLGWSALFLGIAWARFSMTERAPSRWQLRRLAKQAAKSAKAERVAPRTLTAPVTRSFGSGHAFAAGIDCPAKQRAKRRADQQDGGGDFDGFVHRAFFRSGFWRPARSRANCQATRPLREPRSSAHTSACGRAASMACVSGALPGSTSLAKLRTVFASRATRYLWKFQRGAAPVALASCS